MKIIQMANKLSHRFLLPFRKIKNDFDFIFTFQQLKCANEMIKLFTKINRKIHNFHGHLHTK